MKELTMERFEWIKSESPTEQARLRQVYHEMYRNYIEPFAIDGVKKFTDPFKYKFDNAIFQRERAAEDLDLWIQILTVLWDWLQRCNPRKELTSLVEEEREMLANDSIFRHKIETRQMIPMEYQDQYDKPIYSISLSRDNLGTEWMGFGAKRFAIESSQTLTEAANDAIKRIKMAAEKLEKFYQPEFDKWRNILKLSRSVRSFYGSEGYFPTQQQLDESLGVESHPPILSQNRADKNEREQKRSQSGLSYKEMAYVLLLNGQKIIGEDGAKSALREVFGETGTAPSAGRQLWGKYSGSDLNDRLRLDGKKRLAFLRTTIPKVERSSYLTEEGRRRLAEEKRQLESR